ncbi:type I glyceraldehyde-3-phosphate dehydrogenase [Aestuariispira insulae]|uniref:Glyceraldehyde-3-phosphate dehydrogenase n=1 Tax=Aestuariispira insulae TaxID=1461337 RepID=A0A3D9HKF8_9PROT|nr:type I glyceraldehyde-3-phosphate dehydrogenase [Aestuariispira insulae]RED49771.1 glyceraldehyde-3-phosphate dehydrogenase (NAD+) [Aestuariispira insulae]
MTIRVAINGFGRIGRLVLRAAHEMGRNDLEFVAINTPGSVECASHLLQYDSVHGRFQGEVTHGSDWMDLGKGKIAVSAHRDPHNCSWKELGIDVVLECTGIFNTREKSRAHLKAGARKVLLSAPAKDDSLTVVYGVNHDQITAEHDVVSNASCTTNCLAPVAKVLQDKIGIDRGFMTTIHAYTTDQRILDNSHKDLRRARAAGVSMIPTSTGAARAVGKVLPELKGKLDGSAVRVPTSNVSLVDLKFDAARDTSAEEINAAMQEAANNELKGVLAINELPLVSCDFNHHPASSIFDATQTQVSEGTLVQVMAWYDNEWGFSCRMLDTAKVMGELA